MAVKAEHTNRDGRASDAGKSDNVDFSFLPKGLVSQCQMLIESFHDLHGYSCLPDLLWKAGLGPFIEAHAPLRQVLRKASTTRSAKKSNAGFARIATTLLSLEILASRFAGWSSIYPREATRSREILKAVAHRRPNPLIEFYLYPPKHPNPAAIAALAPPQNIYDAELYGLPAERTGHDGAIGQLEAM
jgi:hypothetical protein